MFRGALFRARHSHLDYPAATFFLRLPSGCLEGAEGKKEHRDGSARVEIEIERETLNRMGQRGEKDRSKRGIKKCQGQGIRNLRGLSRVAEAQPSVSADSGYRVTSFARQIYFVPCEITLPDTTPRAPLPLLFNFVSLCPKSPQFYLTNIPTQRSTLAPRPEHSECRFWFETSQISTITAPVETFHSVLIRQCLYLVALKRSFQSSTFLLLIVCSWFSEMDTEFYLMVLSPSGGD